MYKQETLINVLVTNSA